MKIPFNKPYTNGKEILNIKDAIKNGHLSGNGNFTKMCHDFFKTKYGFKKTLLTTSCTDALEMCAILLEIKPGDEIIVPSYTFVSTALAFVRQGAKIIFADSSPDNPNIDVTKVEKLINSRTKAIVCVHYAGVAVDMNYLMNIANKYKLFVVEDAAQSIDSFYKTKPLGTIGHLSTFSFHETKNINSGEGGLLAINDSRFIKRAEIIWEKGTNRTSFFKGEVNKYGWKDIGSSFLPSEIIAAFLYAQLLNLDDIQNRRKYLWQKYYDFLHPISENVGIKLPFIPDFSTNNAHMFYLVCNSIEQRSTFISHLKKNGIHAVFHYQSLHKSDYYKHKYKDVNLELPYSDLYSDRLVRLPLYYELSDDELNFIIKVIIDFIKK